MQTHDQPDFEKLWKAVEALSTRVEALESRVGTRQVDQNLNAHRWTSSSFATPVASAVAPPVASVGSSMGEVLPDLVQENDEQVKEPLFGKLDSNSTSDDNASRQAENATSSSSSKEADSGERAPSLETQIGMYWLSRFGVGFLVVGVSLLITYSFQFFGPWAKLLTGFAVSAFLLLFGEFVEHKQKMRWFGNALAGGGWSLAYFTSYAMHHVPMVRVIDDPITASIAMLAVAGLAVVHALKKNSEVIAILAVMLGYLTLGLTEIGPFSAVASTLLTSAVTLLVSKRKWINLYSIGTLSAFIFLLFYADARISPTDPGLMFSFVIPIWLAASLLPLSFGEESVKGRTAAISIAVLSSIASFVSLKPVFETITNKPDAWLYLLGTLAYAGVAWVMRKRFCGNIAVVNELVSLSCSVLFIPAVYKGGGNLMAWAAQLLLILWTGYKFNIKSFRWFAYPLSLYLFFGCLSEMFGRQSFAFAGIMLPSSFFNIIPAVIALGFATYAFQSEQTKNVVSKATAEFNFYWYLHLCTALAVPMVPLLFSANNNGLGELPLGLTIIGWSFESLSLGLLSLRWQRPYLCLLSLGAFVLTWIASTCTSSIPQHVIPTIYSITICFALAFKYRKNTVKGIDTRAAFGCYLILAALWLFSFQAMKIAQTHNLIYALSAEMLVYMIVGVKLKDALIRACGVLAGLFLMSSLCFNTGLAWMTIIPAVASLYAVGHMYRELQLEAPLNSSFSLFRHFFNYGATASLTIFIGRNFDNSLISCGWAVEGLLLLAAGFALSDKGFRVSGLLVFGVCVFRLLAFDLAGAETLYRILAFIVAGLMLMLGAYAYNWFSKKLDQRGETTMESKPLGS